MTQSDATPSAPHDRWVLPLPCKQTGCTPPAEVLNLQRKDIKATVMEDGQLAIESKNNGRGRRDPGRSPVLDSGKREQFDTGAQRDLANGKGRYDLLPALALRRVALLYEKGAIKYDPCNWMKGMPQWRFIDSGLRHVFRYLAGDTDEDHLAAAVFNLLACIHQQENARLTGSEFWDRLVNDLPQMDYAPEHQCEEKQ